jgi:hypothetical protein
MPGTDTRGCAYIVASTGNVTYHDPVGINYKSEFSHDAGLHIDTPNRDLMLY